MIDGKEGAKKAKQSLSQSMTGHVSQVGKVRLRNCTHCGRSGHGSKSTDREKHCPAYGVAIFVQVKIVQVDFCPSEYCPSEHCPIHIIV